MLQCYLWPVDCRLQGEGGLSLPVLVWIGAENKKTALKQKCKTGRRLSWPDDKDRLSASYRDGLFVGLKAGWIVAVLRTSCSPGSWVRLTRERIGGKSKASGSKKSNFLIRPSTSFGGSHIVLMQLKGYSIVCCVFLTIVFSALPE